MIGRVKVTLLAQLKIKRKTLIINGTLEVIPLTFDLDIGLIHTPTFGSAPMALTP
ncbi:hypothetical protein LFE01_18380 [Limosilactobacillus fermentum]|jgi:hypothetical protein|nr:hypothetical protein LFE01_18380 [Limosilactobacillus fermentum]